MDDMFEQMANLGKERNGEKEGGRMTFNDMDLILSAYGHHLYLGSADAAKDTQAMKDSSISAVLSVCDPEDTPKYEASLGHIEHKIIDAGCSLD